METSNLDEKKKEGRNKLFFEAFYLGNASSQEMAVILN